MNIKQDAEHNKKSASEPQVPNSGTPNYHGAQAAASQPAHPPLHQALVNSSHPDYLSTINALIKQGAELGKSGPHNRTAVQIAMHKKDLNSPYNDDAVSLHPRVEAIKLLLQAGADQSDFEVSLLIYSNQLAERLPKSERPILDDENTTEEQRIAVINKYFPQELEAIQELRRLIKPN